MGHEVIKNFVRKNRFSKIVVLSEVLLKYISAMEIHIRFDPTFPRCIYSSRNQIKFNVFSIAKQKFRLFENDSKRNVTKSIEKKNTSCQRGATVVGNKFP